MEYKDEVGEAQMKLLWESDSQSLSVIPQEFLYPEQLTIPVGVEGNGEGLKGEYFNNADLTDAVLSRTDAGVNFAWGTDSPDAGIDPDTYSARWTGQIEPLYDEDYTFYTQSDDGVRLWVNGELLIDNWDNGNEERASVPISLQGGEKYDIKMEYFEETGEGTAKLLWSSLSQNKEVIPSSQLYPPKESILGVTWTGTIEAEYDEVYTFDINAAEPVRVWIDGQLVIDGTNLPLGGNVAQSGSLLLSASHSYQVKVEYSDNDEEIEGGWVSLDWGSPSQPSTSILYINEPWFHDHIADSSSGSGVVDFETSGVDTYTRIDQKREPQGLFFEGNSGYFEIPFAAPTGDESWVGVVIDIEGPLAEFMEKTGDLDLVNQSFTLEQGDSDKLLAGMLKAIDISGLNKDVLYGSVINVTVAKHSQSYSNESEYDSESHYKRHTVKTSYELYRWLDVVGAKENLGAGVMAGLHEKSENELGEFTKTKEFDYFLPESKGITLAGTNENIDYTQTASGIAGTGTAKWEVSELPIAFTPEEGGDFVGGNGNFVEDTVVLQTAGLEFPLDLKGRVSIGDRVKEIEIERIEAFTKEELTPEEIDEISLEGMRAKLHAADGQAGMRSALVYISLVERDGVEGVETIMIPGDPNQEPVHRFKAVSHDDLKSKLIEFRKNVTNRFRHIEYQKPQNNPYKETIDEIYTDLTMLGIDHLQLIPNDPFLRTMPWSALYDTDKEEHLIEKFSLAISPSFQMTQPQHHDMRNAERSVLAETNFVERENLPAILPEFNFVNHSNVAEIPTDNKFNQDNLETFINQLDNSNGKQLLHIASHADFIHDNNPTNDYIASKEGAGEENVASNVTIDELSAYNFNDLELAIFSACRTGVGNEDREYGFAGTAWGQGAKSAMGSLWNIDDGGSSTLMHAIYHELSNHDLPLAKIQQKVLQAMIEGRIQYEGGDHPKIIYQFETQGEEIFSIPVEVSHAAGFGSGDRTYIHPYYWSAFQIIGSGH